MAKLYLAGSEDVTVERLHEALSERLSSEYDVAVTNVHHYHGNGEHVAADVGKDAAMGIHVALRCEKDGTKFSLQYSPGSSLLLIPIFLLIIPAFRLSRSPARYELEAEVIETIQDRWPDVTVRA